MKLLLFFAFVQAIKAKEALTTYDSVDDDVLQSYAEYALAQLIYYGMKESACSEQSSRMTAMDGASKNAGKYFMFEIFQIQRTFISNLYKISKVFFHKIAFLLFLLIVLLNFSLIIY